MTFHHSQLGRLGEFGVKLVDLQDPDHRSAHLYATDGQLAGRRPDLESILDFKGFLTPKDTRWRSWEKRFAMLVDKYRAKGGERLAAVCRHRLGAFPSGVCGHELIPPLYHWNLRGFSFRIKDLPDTVFLEEGGDLKVTPGWMFVIALNGDVLIGSEDYHLIKHTCLAGGLDVWAAGQVGIQDHRIRLVDLHSGHYVIHNRPLNTHGLETLVSFTRNVVQEYCTKLSVSVLHEGFYCAWP